MRKKAAKIDIREFKKEYVGDSGRVNIQRVVLATVATVGLMGVAVLAPNVLQVITMFRKNDRRYDNAYYLNTVIKNLERKGLIVFEEIGGNKVVRLTEKGEKEYKKYMGGHTSLKQKRWDGKWRLVMFDIKEKRRYVRDKIRAELEHMGFVKLQNSVWVYPYPCEEVVAMLKADVRIGKDVLYIEAERIENDRWLRRMFTLHL